MPGVLPGVLVAFPGPNEQSSACWHFPHFYFVVSVCAWAGYCLFHKGTKTRQGSQSILPAILTRVLWAFKGWSRTWYSLLKAPKLDSVNWNLWCRSSFARLIKLLLSVSDKLFYSNSFICLGSIQAGAFYFVLDMVELITGGRNSC